MSKENQLMKTFIFGKKKLGSLLFYFLKTISYLPFWFWHGIADFLWLLNFYLIGYRKQIVLENLKIAFPEKSERERHKIARQFYRNFSDFIIESIKAFSMSSQSFQKRYHIENYDEVISFVQENKQGAVLTAAHAFSWEWMIFAGHSLPENISAYIAYTPLSNKSLDLLMRQNRERFGLQLNRANKFVEKLKKHPKGHLSLCGLIADQSPKAAYKFKSDFFGVNVPVFTGPERLAREMNQSMWFLNIKRTKRSHYSLSFELLSDAPNDLEFGELTKLYIQKTEDMLRKYPDNYLWTHRRWKHREKNDGSNN